MALEPAGFYQMLLRSLRKLDEEGRREILRGIAGVMDDTWETTVVDRHALLTTVVDVDTIDARWLQHLAPLLGFTADKTIPESTAAQLRRVLGSAVPYWNARPSEEGVIELAIRMSVANAFRVANFFDLRSQIDQTAILEGVPGRDPFVLGFFAEDWEEGVDCDAGGAPAMVLPPTIDAATAFRLHDLLATKSLVTGGYAWLSILSGPNIGFYRISGAYDWNTGLLYDSLPDPTAQAMTWRLYEWMDEFTTHVHVVDPVGGGDYAVPNELLTFLIDFARPHGERIDLHYIWFLDQFFIAEDLNQWDVTSGVYATVEMGAVVGAGENMISNDLQGGSWDDYIAMWTVEAVDDGSIFELSFRAATMDDRYAVLVNVAAGEVELYTYVGGAPAQLGATISVPGLKAGVEDTFRAEAIDVGLGVQLRVHVNGEMIIQHVEAVRTHNNGQVAQSSGTLGVMVRLVEIMPFPMTVERVGPTP